MACHDNLQLVCCNPMACPNSFKSGHGEKQATLKSGGDLDPDKPGYTTLGVGRVQIIWVDYSRTKNRLDIEHSRSLVSTITGTNIQYGGSRKQ